MDGIVYMTAAGLGTAAINAVTVTLAHASLSGVVGYALGHAKFIGSEGHQTRILSLGLAVAMALSGGFSMVEHMATRHGLDYRPAWGLVSAALFAIVVFVFLSFLVDRHLARSPHQIKPATTEPAHEVST